MRRTVLKIDVAEIPEVFAVLVVTEKEFPVEIDSIFGVRFSNVKPLVATIACDVMDDQFHVQFIVVVLVEISLKRLPRWPLRVEPGYLVDDQHGVFGINS